MKARVSSVIITQDAVDAGLETREYIGGGVVEVVGNGRNCVWFESKFLVNLISFFCSISAGHFYNFAGKHLTYS